MRNTDFVFRKIAELALECSSEHGTEYTLLRMEPILLGLSDDAGMDYHLLKSKLRRHIEALHANCVVACSPLPTSGRAGKTAHEYLKNSH